MTDLRLYLTGTMIQRVVRVWWKKRTIQTQDAPVKTLPEYIFGMQNAPEILKQVQ